MSIPLEPSIGIDLGTTFSVIARLGTRGELETLPNAEGDRVTPSVVLFEGENIVVGKEALKAVSTDMDHVAECSKREIGRGMFHKVINGRQYPPEVIAALILNKLRVDAGQQIGPFSKAVVTVPAYFDEVRRKATQDAGYMAGLEVLDIINEPTAAAVAFGYRQGFLGVSEEGDRPRRIVVYDLGGGTFDVTVMEMRGTDFVVLATDGDVNLGGYDWDQRLADLVVEAFRREHGVDPRQDANTVGRLWRECEDTKRTLSARTVASAACDYRGLSSRIEISREQFEAATQDLLDVTRSTTVRTLQAAGLNWPDVNHLLLVGGSSRMPMVRHMLRELSGLEPDASVAADEAVAHGAVLRADLLLALGQGQPPTFNIRNVNSHSLGVIGTDQKTQRKVNATVIPRNTPLPVTQTQRFVTRVPDQRSILVRIIEGESPLPDDCTQIGECAIRDLPPGLPARSPVYVSFQYEPNGRLRVHVEVPNTGRQVETEIVRKNSLGKEEMDAWRKYICGLDPTDYR